MPSALPIDCPGFFDLQVNGFAGVDFNDPRTSDEELLRATLAMRATGVTRFLPTLITSSLASFSACAAKLVDFSHPANAGIHMEGPYLAPAARGAHPPEHLALPSLEDWKRRQEAARGRIVLVTLAPELPGALALIEALVQEGVRVAIGHSAATPAAIRDAIAAGASMSTHLGNGAPRELPRHPNLIWEQLAADELCAGLIVDGHHLAPSVVKAMVRAKTPARVALVTDAIAAASQPPGPFALGTVRAERHPDGRVTLLGDTRLAGSALTLDAAVGLAARFTGLPVEQVLPLASAQPARAIGQQPAGRVIGRWDPIACRLSVDRVQDD